MGGAGENTRPLACQPPACDGKKTPTHPTPPRAIAAPAPRAIAERPIGNTGPNRGT